MTNVPDTMQQDAFELDAKAEVTLFKLVLSDNTTFYMSPKREYTWQGNLYEEIACHMTKFRRQADGEVSRPKFTIVNPSGIFTSAVHTGLLETAQVTRHKILKEDLDADLNKALSHTMRITQVRSVDRKMIVCECRGALDGPNFKLPRRAYYPPEYPFVSLR